MKRTAILAALLAGSSVASPALAADLPRRAAPIMQVPVLASDWSGVYFGIQGGYGWGEQALNATSLGDAVPFTDAVFSDVSAGSIKQRGGLFGGLFGVQKQWGSWVVGLEGDIDGASIKGLGRSIATNAFDGEGCQQCNLSHNLSVDSKIDMLGSVRGKIGLVPGPDWMFYGTGGLAFAHVKNTLTDTETVTGTPGFPAPGGIFHSFTGSGSNTMFGWAAGAGIDWKVWHDAGSAWILGVEYLHYGFGTQTFTVSDNIRGSFANNGAERVDIIKGRISYLFSIH